MDEKEKEIKIEGEETQEQPVEETAEQTTEQTEATSDEPVAEETAESNVEKLQEEVEQLKDRYLRTVAEFDNYKKRTIKEKAELILNGGEKVVTSLLPVLDDFERALNDATDDPHAIKEGMDLIFKKFLKTLETLGVKKIETEGKDFDVDFHEAIAMIPNVPDAQKGKVVDCVQSGYQMNDKVIRHAKVAVGQ